MNLDFGGSSAHNLNLLCKRAKELIHRQEYDACDTLIKEAMQLHPHAAQPHNLMGILLECKGDHTTAMRHFRAAWALDPTYMPARFNLEHIGTFFSKGKYAYEESDCPGAHISVFGAHDRTHHTHAKEKKFLVK